MKPAVFLDRDDTLMRANDLPPPPPPGAPGDVVDPDLVELLPGAAEAVWRLKSAGFAIVVVSNQGCVARGAATTQRVDEVNAQLERLLSAHAAWFGSARGSDGDALDHSRGMIDAFYYCPYHPKGTVPEFTREHPHRKPQPGMILAARNDLKLDLARSWLIGDAARDIEAGIAAGIDAERCLRIGPDGPFPDVLSAAWAILDAQTTLPN
jgi:D-glycero-D-manno-heptose 1,7-bisphosphate phosphatase